MTKISDAMEWAIEYGWDDAVANLPWGVKLDRIRNKRYFVYFMTDGKYWKIGKSANPKERLSKLQTGNPKKLRIVHLIQCYSQKEANEVEREIHNKYRLERENGEWFRPHPDFDLLSDTSEICECNDYKEFVMSVFYWSLNHFKDNYKLTDLRKRKIFELTVEKCDGVLS